VHLSSLKNIWIKSAVFDTPREGKAPPFGGSFFCPATIGNKNSGHRDTVDLTLTLFSIALFSSTEAHRLVIVDVLWAVYDGNHFALGTNGLTGTLRGRSRPDSNHTRLQSEPCSTPSDLLPARGRLPRDFAAIERLLDRMRKRQLMPVRIGHVEVAFTP